VVNVSLHYTPVMTVMHFTVHADRNGNLSTKATYETGVNKAYQVWAHQHPDHAPGAVYLGVVFRLNDVPSQWLAVDARGALWHSYAVGREKAAQFLANRFFA
jgi:hypothetical protein